MSIRGVKSVRDLLLQETKPFRKQAITCNMTTPELQDAIDEALSIIDMGLLSGKDLEAMKEGAAFLARTLLRRKTKLSS